MSITLYQKKDYKGRSMTVSRNYKNLKDTDLGNHPSSLKMTDADDAVLLFDKKDWNGGVMYFRGKRSMTSLGKKSQGGELFSANSVTSVRFKPFTLKLNFEIVTRSDGTFPGGHSGETTSASRGTRFPVRSVPIEKLLTGAVHRINELYERNHALLDVSIADFDYKPNDGKFDLTKSEANFPADWKEKRQIDVIVVNTLKGAYGMAKFPWWGKVTIVELDDRDTDEVARTLAHEIGHYLGLTHGTGNGSAKNLMTPSVRGLPIGESTLTPAQIEEMHQKLARNLTRQGDRHN